MEILAPAGNLEKLKYALAYGADAVYAGSQNFSLRSKADNFNDKDILEATNLCHKDGKKLFVPINIYAYNRHISKLKDYIKKLAEATVDALIVSDLGVLDIINNIAPHIPVHISTQANVTSYQAVKAYQKLGAKRIILARELTFSEIKEIRNECQNIELEIFIHGAMCISYSGRCLLSAFFNDRNANVGECTQPCRWKYSLIEESRPNHHFPINEDDHGFYFMNSKDLCLWSRLKQIYEAGIDSVKIEGRMKSIYYIAATTRAYKQSLVEIEKGYPANDYWREELEKISHRVYTEAFFDKFDAKDTQNYQTTSYIRNWQFVGNIIDKEENLVKVKSYHKIESTDEIEIIFPDNKSDLVLKNFVIYDENKNIIRTTKPNSCFYLKIDEDIPDYGVIRLKKLD